MEYLQKIIVKAIYKFILLILFISIPNISALNQQKAENEKLINIFQNFRIDSLGCNGERIKYKKVLDSLFLKCKSKDIILSILGKPNVTLFLDKSPKSIVCYYYLISKCFNDNGVIKLDPVATMEMNFNLSNDSLERVLYGYH